MKLNRKSIIGIVLLVVGILFQITGLSLDDSDIERVTRHIGISLEGAAAVVLLWKEKKAAQAAQTTVDPVEPKTPRPDSPLLAILLLVLLFVGGCAPGKFYESIKTLYPRVGNDWRAYVEKDPTLDEEDRKNILRADDDIRQAIKDEGEKFNILSIPQPATQPAK